MQRRNPIPSHGRSRPLSRRQGGAKRSAVATLAVACLGLGPLLALPGASASAAFAPAGGMQTRVLHAHSDTYVSARAPRRNFGSSRRLVAEQNTSNLMIRFRLPKVMPRPAKVTLVLHRLKHGHAGVLSISRTAPGWSAKAVTQRTQPVRRGRSLTVKDNGRSPTVTIDVSSLVHGRSLRLAITRTSGAGMSVFGSRQSGRQQPRLTISIPTDRVSRNQSPTNGVSQNEVPSSESGSEAPPTDAPASPACGMSRIGIPDCGAYVGAAVGGNTDPSDFEGRIGGSLGVHRTYYQANQTDWALRTAARDLAQGRLPWISFKLPYSWADMADGKGDAWARDLAHRLSELDGPVWLAFHHEPERDGNIKDWTRIQQRLAPIVHQTAANVAFTIIVTGWNQIYGPSQYSLDAIWPGDGVVDVIGFDVYQSYGTSRNGRTTKTFTDLDSEYFAPLSAFAARHGTHWGVAETGLTDQAAAAYPNWIADAAEALEQRGGVAFTYFDSALNSTESYEISSPAKEQQFARALGSSARIAPTHP